MNSVLMNLKKIRSEFGMASPLVKTVISAAIALSLAAMVSLCSVKVEAERATAELLERAAALKQENAELQEMVDNMDTVSGIRQIAARELGLVDPNTVIFDSE